MALGEEPTVIVDFVRSGSLRGLQRAILANNLRAGHTFNYFQIMRDGNDWYAFYYRKVDELSPDIKKLMLDETTDGST